MIEKALIGGKRYWGWLAVLSVVIILGLLAYLKQFNTGLAITGLSRDVPWGFYIAQFTFLVGVAASAVMVVLPYYLHNFKDFGKMTILGEFLAISSVIMCMLFIFVDMGNPIRIVNVFLHPTPHSLMFWDSVVLMGYLLLNVVISQVTFNSERKGIAPPKWIKPVIVLSIPWAVSIHTVTAFLYSGLAARPFWLTAILAPRFLASAFAAGPAFLVILCLVMKKFANYDVGREPLKKLGVIIAYAMSINIFFVLLELFTALYSDIPEHMHHFEYLFFGLDGNDFLVPFMWTSEILAVVSLVLLLVPKLRQNSTLLGLACVTVIVSLWIDKGMGLVITGFIPSTLGQVVKYVPTLPELMITISIYAIGFLVLTVLYKVAIAVREEIGYK
ncbi:MAG: polysulfide reductase NrfD [candidate division Zixibacteria bacterium]|nr:polysulfide reductase NrfD [candidate division Zixibacteria bacterium]